MIRLHVEDVLDFILMDVEKVSLLNNNVNTVKEAGDQIATTTT